MAKHYIAGKLVPELLRQKIINIDGADETEFINIDEVEVKELTDAFALTKPYSVDVKLSRYSERDIKYEFHLVVKVSDYSTPLIKLTGKMIRNYCG
jgi:hypothetical protein